jgi:hypothetical protein
VRELFFSQQSLQLQKQLYRDLTSGKKVFKGEKPIPVGFLRKAIVLNRIYVYRNRRLKIHFQRCYASENKTRKIKTNSNSILTKGMF